MLEGQVVAVRCAHGERVVYPLADITVQIGGKQLTVRAGVSDSLPVELILGRDVPELLDLLREESRKKPGQEPERPEEEVVAVTTRSKPRDSETVVDSPIAIASESVDRAVASEQVASEQVASEQVASDSEFPVPVESGTVVAPIKESVEEECPADFDDDLFDGGRERRRLTRSQKWTEKRKYYTTRRQESTGTMAGGLASPTATSR